MENNTYSMTATPRETWVIKLNVVKPLWTRFEAAAESFTPKNLGVKVEYLGNAKDADGYITFEITVWDPINLYLFGMHWEKEQRKYFTEYAETHFYNLVEADPNLVM